MARLDLDPGAIVPAAGKRDGYRSHRQLCTKISGKFDSKILLHELETMTNEAKENPISHWTFTTPTAMIGGALVCLFILFCCWRLCRQFRICSDSVPLSLSTSSSTNRFQHDGRPHQKMKSLKTLFSFCIVSYKISFSLFPLSKPPNNKRDIR